MELKSRLGSGARVLSGGQSLVPLLRQRLAQPDALISLGRIAGLADIRVNGGASIGAMTTVRAIEVSPELRKVAPILPLACSSVASVHVRTMGTIGGNLCHAEVGSDPPQALLLLDAQVDAVSARGHRGISIHDFVQGYFTSVLDDDEIVTGFSFTAPSPSARFSYKKYSLRAMDLAIAAVGVGVDFVGDRCEWLRIAVGGVGPRPVRARQAEADWHGCPLNDLTRNAGGLGEDVAREVEPSLSDVFGSEGYRRRLVRAGVKQAIESLAASYAEEVG
ncbi:MAG: hypothetical protein GEU28_07955 [Dehalococcoidia bacterium]|nr:hypothetical protein [Dehalococcoidia bacterium]